MCIRDRAGSSFSPHDVQTAALAGMAEMRAVAPGFVFTIRPREGGLWPAPDRVGTVFDMVKDKNDQRISRAIIDGSIDSRQAIADGPHLVWVELAPLMGLEYRREAANGDR